MMGWKLVLHGPCSECRCLVTKCVILSISEHHASRWSRNIVDVRSSGLLRRTTLQIFTSGANLPPMKAPLVMTLGATYAAKWLPVYPSETISSQTFCISDSNIVSYNESHVHDTKLGPRLVQIITRHHPSLPAHRLLCPPESVISHVSPLLHKVPPLRSRCLSLGQTAHCYTYMIETWRRLVFWQLCLMSSSHACVREWDKRIPLWD